VSTDDAAPAPPAAAILRTSLWATCYEQQRVAERFRGGAKAAEIGDGSAAPGYRRAPARDEDRDHILRGLLGYDQATVTAYEQAGAFGSWGEAAGSSAAGR